MWQMADRCVSSIVGLRRHLDYLAAQRSPELLRFFQDFYSGAFQRREDDLLAAVKARLGMLDTCHLFARNGVRRYK